MCILKGLEIGSGLFHLHFYKFYPQILSTHSSDLLSQTRGFILKKSSQMFVELVVTMLKGEQGR